MSTENDGISILGPRDGAEDILTVEALDLVGALERKHGPGRRKLLENRHQRDATFKAGQRPQLLAETKDIREDPNWSVPTAPIDLVDRRCEITGPSERKMMISALN